MNGSELKALKNTAKPTRNQMRILQVLSGGPSYQRAIAEEAELSEGTVRRSLNRLNGERYVTNWVHTFNGGALQNISVSAWRLLNEKERLDGRVDPNIHRRKLTTLNAKTRRSCVKLGDALSPYQIQP